MASTTTVHSLLLTVAVITVVGVSLGSAYSLSATQCQDAVQNIGEALKTEQGDKKTLVKGTWVSPRCELRRLQSSALNGEKTASLLRMIDIQSRRRWSGAYYFYSDQDCVEPVYAVELHGHVVTDGDIAFNITTIKIATYKDDKGLIDNYNRTCPGYMSLEYRKSNARVYSVPKQVPRDSECLKGIGLDHNEFKGALYQTNTLDDDRTTELLMKSVDLRPSKKAPSNSQQWPLRPHSSRMCLTCNRVGLGKLQHPPKLYARNSSNIDGLWGSARCHMEGRSVYTTRFDKISGDTFERSFYAFEKPECKEATFRLRTVGKLRHVGDSLEVPGGVVYQMTVQKAFLTAYTESMARIFGVTSGRCGVATWEKGKTQDLGPTNGCYQISYVMGPPELVLFRTLLDENRNELYFGTDMSGVRHKGGPVTYNYISQDCSRFPVAMTEPTQSIVYTDPPQLEMETTPVYATTEKLLANNEVLKDKKNASARSSITSFPLLVACVLARIFF